MIYHSEVIEAIENHVTARENGSDVKFDVILESIEHIEQNISKIRSSNKGIYDPNLPIDLISYSSYEQDNPEGIKQTYYKYTIYIVISTSEIPDDLSEKVLFYKSYLSRVISTIDILFVLVVPVGLKGDLVDQEFVNSNGLGLWTFDNDIKIQEILRSYSLREVIQKDYQEANPDNIEQFVDKYINVV